MKRIVMTGGGTAGHVTPNIAIIKELYDLHDIYYIGSKNSIEEKLIKEQGIRFYGISSGKFRRNFDLKNITDIFKILKGYKESISILRKIKPDLIFSKGGYVTVPVILASKITRTPVIIHESDLSIGLANKISIPIAKKVCVTFSKTFKDIGNEKAILTGPPIRREIIQGNKQRGEKFCNFKKSNPYIVFIGGSQGSKSINELVRKNINALSNFNIIHICGKNNIDSSIVNDNYLQFEYLEDELKDIFAMADIIVSRAGSNTIYEILSLKKPNLLIPLSRNASRGDQIQNAEEFELQGFSKVLQDDDKLEQLFIPTLLELFDNKAQYINNMNKYNFVNGTDKIIEVIKEELS